MGKDEEWERRVGDKMEGGGFKRQPFHAWHLFIHMNKMQEPQSCRACMHRFSTNVGSLYKEAINAQKREDTESGPISPSTYAEYREFECLQRTISSAGQWSYSVNGTEPLENRERSSQLSASVKSNKCSTKVYLFPFTLQNHFNQICFSWCLIHLSSSHLL